MARKRWTKSWEKSKERFEESKERLEDVPEELAEKGEEVLERGEELRKDVEKRSTELAERLRDGTLKTVYKTSAATLSAAANWGDRVPFVRQQANTLRDRADSLREAEEAVERPPIDDYDELNVREVADELDDLSDYQLQKVRRYEEANKDRVTVLRDVDRLLG